MTEPEQNEITLNEKQTEQLMDKIDGKITCLMCPYFKPYNIDVQVGMAGKCQAIEIIADEKAKKGTLGKIRATIMRTLAKATWSAMVDQCDYHRRADKITQRQQQGTQ